jgi:hypothetical protein
MLWRRYVHVLNMKGRSAFDLRGVAQLSETNTGTTEGMCACASMKLSRETIQHNYELMFEARKCCTPTYDPDYDHVACPLQLNFCALKSTPLKYGRYKWGYLVRQVYDRLANIV